MLSASNQTPTLPLPVPFFLYNDVTILHGLMGHCLKRKKRRLEKRSRWTTAAVDLRYDASLGAVHEFAAAKYFARMMMTHPWRTFEPAEAEVFIIPIDVDPSDLDEDDSQMCGPQMYEQHLFETMRLVFQQSHIRKKSGADHFWMMSASYPERLIEKFAPTMAEALRTAAHLHFMTVGVMELFPGRSLKATPLEGSDLYTLKGDLRKRPWRCSLPVPFVQSFPFSKHEAEPFEAWTKRRYMFYHQFSGFYQDEYSRSLRAQALKVPSVARRPARVWVGDKFVPSSELQRGFQSSRFCFAIAGRNGGPTRKFYDAVLHNCIPVVVSDQWLYAFAPFAGHIRHEAYAVFIPEEQWMRNLTGVVRRLEAMPRRELAARYQALLEVAPLLSYDRPDSHALGSVLLWELRQQCGTQQGPVRDEKLYPVDVPLRRLRPTSPLNGLQVAEELFRHPTQLSWKWHHDPATTSDFMG
ncbi:GT11 [Symbiodinium natans]|uniref:GT11 protein n=1 Tax=Symbiodinium natans TaxID=878477 RepID=A0A812MN03_9DINO|nr:GT11 [Symbiodinium natans]